MCLPRVASPGPATLSGVSVVPSQPLSPSTPNGGGMHLDWVSTAIDVSSISLNRAPTTSMSRSDHVNRAVIDLIMSVSHATQIERRELDGRTEVDNCLPDFRQCSLLKAYPQLGLRHECLSLLESIVDDYS
jgi:hypothetical protein